MVKEIGARIKTGDKSDETRRKRNWWMPVEVRSEESKKFIDTREE
jgi:hypothetical protein